MYNHVIEGSNVMPRGEWTQTWTDSEGMHGKAEVYDVDYNKDLIEYLQHASSPRVSLQITGDAEQVKDEDGKYYIREIIRKKKGSITYYWSPDSNTKPRKNSPTIA